MTAVPDTLDPIATATLRQVAAARLADVIDPEVGIDIVALGLIYGIDIGDGELSVHMAVTTPFCPLAGQLAYGARLALDGLPGVERTWVDLTFDPPWHPAMMSAEAHRARFGPG